METWKDFLAKYPLKTYAKGQVIVCQDSAPAICYVIKKGFVKAYTIAASGDEKPVSFEGKDDLFPMDLVFGRSEEAKYFYQAHTDCQVYHVPRKDFLTFLNEQPAVLKRLFNYVIDRTIDYHEHIASLERAKAVDKIVCALNFLSKRFGKEMAKSYRRLTLPLTQQDLANFLGLTRETTGTQLKTLEREGILHHRRQLYVVDSNRLEAMAEESC